MDIKDFVSQAIVEIAEGIFESRARLFPKGVSVAGACQVDKNGNIIDGLKRGDCTTYNYEIHFDIAVVVSSGTSVSTGGALRVLGLGVDAKGIDETLGSTTSRIKFIIPVNWNHHPAHKEQ